MLNNISRRQFAEKVSVNESYLSRILNRKDPITGSFLLNIKKYYQDIDISFDIDVKIPETKTVKKFTENVTPRNFNFRHVPVVSKYAFKCWTCYHSHHKNRRFFFGVGFTGLIFIVFNSLIISTIFGNP